MPVSSQRAFASTKPRTARSLLGSADPRELRIKRHLAVDTLGFPFFSHCTKANVSDDRGLIEMLSNNIDYFKFKPVNIPKITILIKMRISPQKTGGRIKDSLSSNHEQD